MIVIIILTCKRWLSTFVSDNHYHLLMIIIITDLRLSLTTVTDNQVQMIMVINGIGACLVESMSLLLGVDFGSLSKIVAKCKV